MRSLQEETEGIAVAQWKKLLTSIKIAMSPMEPGRTVGQPYGPAWLHIATGSRSTEEA